MIIQICLDDWKKIDELFGLGLIESSPEISDEAAALVLERERARSEKDFQKADQIRDELAKLGFEVKDTTNGPIWQYLK